ncbi:hypothetical protein WJX72_010559 [[Myrmecia] bisecta]|uniref:Uncharacterized protein n=1 Tax=[Myrmecia] bisecta TaxID=41462 RepID=A0AAW1Q810_9CHLO
MGEFSQCAGRVAASHATLAVMQQVLLNLFAHGMRLLDATMNREAASAAAADRIRDAASEAVMVLEKILSQYTPPPAAKYEELQWMMWDVYCQSPKTALLTPEAKRVLEARLQRVLEARLQRCQDFDKAEAAAQAAAEALLQEEETAKEAKGSKKAKKKQAKQKKGQPLQANQDWQPHVSLDEMECPITHEVMTDPVIAVDGYTAWYKGLSPRLALLEPVLKIVGPILGLLVELWLDHGGHFLTLFCRDGRINGLNVHNFQHAASYPAFIVSAGVDLLGFHNPGSVIRGSEHAFLGLAFGLESMLMLLHKKHAAVDAMVHWLLGLTMGATSTAVFLDACFSHPLVPSLKTTALTVQGAWLCCIGGLMYTKRGIELGQDEHSMLMLVPILLACIILVAAIAQLAAAVAIPLCCGKRPTTAKRPASGGYGRIDSKSESELDLELAAPEPHSA